MQSRRKEITIIYRTCVSRFFDGSTHMRSAPNLDTHWSWLISFSGICFSWLAGPPPFITRASRGYGKTKLPIMSALSIACVRVTSSKNKNIQVYALFFATLSSIRLSNGEYLCNHTQSVPLDVTEYEIGQLMRRLSTIYQTLFPRYF